jgi:hypothetical protein
MTTNYDDLTVTAQPERITSGGIVRLQAELPQRDDKFAVEWIVTGPTQLSTHDRRIALLGATTVTGDEVTLTDDAPTVLEATLDTRPLSVGSWQVELRLTEIDDGEDGDVLIGITDPIEVLEKPFTSGDDVAVTLKRTAIPPTDDQSLWVTIRNSTNAIGFQNYSRFIEAVICDDDDDDRFDGRRIGHRLRKVKRRSALPFPNVDRYRLLKAATEVFLMTHCGVDLGDFSRVDLDEESRRLGRTVEPGDLEEQMRDYLLRVPAGEGDFIDVLPYLGLIRLQLRDVPVVGIDARVDDAANVCFGLIAEKLTNPCFVELIHEYWHAAGNVVRAMNAIGWRFQNRRTSRGRYEPLMGLNVAPLFPLNNLLWGLVQDQQHRLPHDRFEAEVAHEYGLELVSRRRPPLRTADPRSRFVPAFNDLLSLSAVFYTQDDNTTVIADGFAVLNALKETHLLLSEGAHNAFGDLPTTARLEMLMYQWILSRPETREFLPTRTMVVYPEPWISSVDAVNQLMGWTDIPALHFRDLAVFGEQLLLSIRFGAWTDVIEADLAANWARYWRPEVQGYIHAYRAVTGIDLTQRGYRLRERAREGAYRA